MFDERRRDFDGYYAHLAYVKEEKEQAIAEGLQQGRLGTVVNLIKKGIITKEEACEELGVSVQELEKHL